MSTHRSKKSLAVIVRDVNKRFGNPDRILWKRLSRLSVKSSGKPPESLDVVNAVDHVSFTLERGDVFGILGARGVGKSTLIHLLAGLLTPDSGSIHIFGIDTSSQPRQALGVANHMTLHAGFFMRLSALDNLLYDASDRSRSSELRSKATETLLRLGLDEYCIHIPMRYVSHSVHQRVALTRALISSPRLLLLDEPVKGLDPETVRQLQEMILELRDTLGVTVVYATDNLQEIYGLCDRTMLMCDGKLTPFEMPEALPMDFVDCQLDPTGVETPIVPAMKMPRTVKEPYLI